LLIQPELLTFTKTVHEGLSKIYVYRLICYDSIWLPRVPQLVEWPKVEVCELIRDVYLQREGGGHQ
jgi:hypothetical protein